MKYSPQIVAIFSLLLSSCSRPSPQPTLPVNSLTLAAYQWVFNQEENSWEVYVAALCSIDSIGNCCIARKDTFLGADRCFEVALPEQLFKQARDVEWNNLSPAYMPGEQDQDIYDGFTYCFIWNKNDSIRYSKFIPRYIVDGHMSQLFAHLNDFIWALDAPSKEQIDYSIYTQYITTHIADSTKLPPYRGEIEFKESDVKH